MYLQFHQNLLNNSKGIHKSSFIPLSEVVLKMNKTKPKSKCLHEVHYKSTILSVWMKLVR